MPDASRWTALRSLWASATAHHHISFDYPCIVVVLQYSTWRNTKFDFLAFHVLRSTVWAIFLNAIRHHDRSYPDTDSFYWHLHGIQHSGCRIRRFCTIYRNLPGQSHSRHSLADVLLYRYGSTLPHLLHHHFSTPLPRG